MRTVIALCTLLAWAGPALAQGFGMQVPDRNEMLTLVRHDVRVRVDHPVAQITVTQEFQNPHPFNLEAFFSYPVPPGATVTGLALWVGGVRREARMLERQRAREIYRGIVAQKRDPALLEKDAGNNFRIRIFPVLARSRQRVELTFVQPVQRDSDGSYRVTLRRPPGATVHALRLGLRLRPGFALRWARLEGYPGQLQHDDGVYRLPRRAAEQSFERDIHLRYAAAGPIQPRVVSAVDQDQQLFVAELPLQDSAADRRAVAVLLDASTSMAPHLQGAGQLVRALAARLDSDDRLALVPFGLLPRVPVALQPVGEQRGALAEQLQEIVPRGGTAFVPALEQALASGARHVVLISDGGTRYHQAELEHLLRLVHDQTGVTVSVVLVQQGPNEEPLADLAAISGGLFARLDPGHGARPLAARLASHRSGRQGARLSGCAQGEARVLRAGEDRLLVTGTAAGCDGTAEIRFHGRGIKLPLSTAPRSPAVAGLFGAAAIAHRMRGIKVLGETEERRREVVALSRRYHVLSEYTALLATETDGDYARPTSGRKWQRTPTRIGDHLPPTQFQSTPEPHEWAMIGLGLLLLLIARRRGWLARRPAARG